MYLKKLNPLPPPTPPKDTDKILPFILLLPPPLSFPPENNLLTKTPKSPPTHIPKFSKIYSSFSFFLFFFLPFSFYTFLPLPPSFPLPPPCTSRKGKVVFISWQKRREYTDIQSILLPKKNRQPKKKVITLNQASFIVYL